MDGTDSKFRNSLNQSSNQKFKKQFKKLYFILIFASLSYPIDSKSIHHTLVHILILLGSTFNMGNRTSSGDIYTFIDQGDLESLEDALFEDEIDLLNDEGETLLFRACSVGNAQIVSSLLQHGADLSISCDDITCIHVASTSHSPKCVQLLLEKGADANSTTLDLTTPLHCAVQHGDFIAAKMLIEAGANVEAKDNQGLRPFDMEPIDHPDYESAPLLTDAQMATLETLASKINNYEEADYHDDIETMRLFFRSAGLGAAEARTASAAAIDLGCKSGKKLSLKMIKGELDIKKLGLIDEDDIELLKLACKETMRT